MFSVFLSHGRYVFSVCVYTYTTIPATIHNYICVSNSLCVQSLYMLCLCVISVNLYTYKGLPICLIACVFSVVLCYGRCVLSVCVYTYTTIPVCLIACVFSVSLFHGRCVFSVCIYTHTTIPVCLLHCVFSVFHFHGRCVFSVCVGPIYIHIYTQSIYTICILTKVYLYA